MTLKITRGIKTKAQKVVLMGPEGIGKTAMASCFSNPLFIDLEDGSCHIDVSRTEKPMSWSELMEQIRQVSADKPCSTLVIDTADWAEALCEKHVCSKNRWESIASPAYGVGYEALKVEFSRFLDALSDVVDAGVNVCVCAHAAMRKFEQPDEEAAYDRWELKLQKKTAPKLKEWADAILFLNYKTTVETVAKGKAKARNARRVIYCCHHACWDAKNRWGLPDEVPFSYESIASYIPDIVGGREPARRPEDAPDSPVAAPAEPDVPEGDAGTESPQAASDGPDVPEWWLPVLRMLDGTGHTLDDVRAVSAHHGHYTLDTPLSSMPKEYVEGCVLPNWDQFAYEMDALTADVPFS